MPLIAADDAVRLFCSDEGEGVPILFAHEFGGDWRSWDLQAGAFAKRFRCIRYCARGFLPSDVPAEVARYGQERATADLAGLVETLGLGRFHLVGCSMGSYTSLMYALSNAEHLASLTLVGCSTGARSDDERLDYRRDLQRQLDLLEAEGGEGAVAWLEADSAYRRLAEKVPTAWQAYKERLRHQSVAGARRTLSSLHWHRRSLWTLERALGGLAVPTLLIQGEEDHPLVRATGAYLAATLPVAKTITVPATGHLVQIEEPGLFEAELSAHIAAAVRA
ncbi:MAG: alpha/beta hydrolase [Kiloniellales bacterium]|nr:alpha/beta hydrolase [Kiloniellales bacterium]